MGSRYFEIIMTCSNIKSRVIFFILPQFIKSGSDCVSYKGVEILKNHGILSDIYEIWPNNWSRLLLKSGTRLGHLLLKYIVSPLSATISLDKIRAGDLVWMYDISNYARLNSYNFEKACKARGAKYIFHLHDDWFSVKGYKDAAMHRAQLADMVGGLTQGLVNSLRSACPQTNPLLLRGPIDIDRLKPLAWNGTHSKPRVIWTGNPNNLKEIPGAMEVLEKVYSKSPFEFQIISGNVRPKLDLPIPWTWLPYDADLEAERISGACAGLAPLEDTPYARCKDVFKVKTYMACGVPPIATAIGNNLEVIRDGETGFLVRTQAEWEARLIDLISNPAKAAAMGQAARKDCVERFSHEAIIPEWIEALESRFGRLREGSS